MKSFASIAAAIVILTAGTAAQTSPDPKMTRVERAEIIDLLNKTEKEFLQAVESLTDQQWAFKAAPERWSIAECAEHIVLSEALMFDLATKSVAGPADEKWEATLNKTNMLRRALPDRSTKVDAPAAIKPQRAMTRAELMARFKQQ